MYYLRREETHNMRFKLLYTKWQGNQKLIALVDFQEEQLIELTLDELEKENLGEDIKAYIISVMPYIEDQIQ
jgi:hypothetical protein